MILCVGTTPALQRVLVLSGLTLGEVNRARLALEGASGKAINVAKVLRSLGDECLVTGFLGGLRGEAIERLLTDRGVPRHFLRVQEETRQCLTLVDEVAGTQTELVEESKPVTSADATELISFLCKMVPRSKAVIMSGTICRGVEDSLYRDLVELGNAAGSLTVVDAKGQPLAKALRARPGLVKPNRAELAETLCCDVRTESECLAAMKQILLAGASRILVTAGNQPVLAMDNEASWRISGPRLDIKNPIGSGDALTAGVTSRLLKGDEFGEACRWGVACGSANALSLMPGELEKSQVTEILPLVKVERLP